MSLELGKSGRGSFKAFPESAFILDRIIEEPENTGVVVELDESSENWSKSFLRIELFSCGFSFLGEFKATFSSALSKNGFSSAILLMSKLEGKLRIV